MPELVSLYRCKRCRVRLFLCDCPGHYVRCRGGSIKEATARTAQAFERGPQVQHARPGDAHPVQVHRGRARKPRVAQGDDEEPAAN